MTSSSLFSLPPSAYQAFILVLRYLASRDRTTYCFTYRGLRSWLHYSRSVSEKPEWHTVERAIRLLAAQRVFNRVRRGRTVIFCPGPRFFEFKYSYVRLLEESSPRGELRELLEFLKASP